MIEVICLLCNQPFDFNHGRYWCKTCNIAHYTDLDLWYKYTHNSVILYNRQEIIQLSKLKAFW